MNKVDFLAPLLKILSLWKVREEFCFQFFTLAAKTRLFTEYIEKYDLFKDDMESDFLKTLAPQTQII